MNLIKKFVTGLGNQTAPFGFAPEDPEAGYKAGLGYIGDIGANLLANNQGGVDPFANLGASLQQAKQSGTQRNKEQYTAQRLMEEAQLKRQEREAEAARKQQMEDAISQLPPDQQALARMVPEKFFGAQIDQMFGKPDTPALVQEYLAAKQEGFPGSLADWKTLGRGGAGAEGSPELGLNLVPLQDADGNFAGWGQPSKGGGIYPAQIQGEGGVMPMSPYDRKFAESAGGKEGSIVGEARAELPGSVVQAETTKLKIERLLKDPDLKTAIGYKSWLPDIMAPNSVIKIRGYVEELMGTAFLEARNMLKGQGPITDFESGRAEKAYARMEKAIKAGDPAVFEEALTDFDQAVDDGIRKLRANARVSSDDDGWTTAPNGVRIRKKGP
jgi:hypothetical protein